MRTTLTIEDRIARDLKELASIRHARSMDFGTARNNTRTFSCDRIVELPPAAVMMKLSFALFAVAACATETPDAGGPPFVDDAELLHDGKADGGIMRLGRTLIGKSAQRVIDGFFESIGREMGANVTALASPEAPQHF